MAVFAKLAVYGYEEYIDAVVVENIEPVGSDIGKDGIEAAGL